MKYTITIGTETHTFALYREVEAFILNTLRMWNNFDSHPHFAVAITRAPSSDDPPALSINVGDAINTEDVFGG